MLYPLKFEPILKDKIWGGTKLKNIFNKPATSDKLGESWELSGYENDESTKYMTNTDLLSLCYLSLLMPTIIFPFRFIRAMRWLPNATTRSGKPKCGTL